MPAAVRCVGTCALSGGQERRPVERIERDRSCGDRCRRTADSFLQERDSPMPVPRLIVRIGRTVLAYLNAAVSDRVVVIALVALPMMTAPVRRRRGRSARATPSGAAPAGRGTTTPIE